MRLKIFFIICLPLVLFTQTLTLEHEGKARDYTPATPRCENHPNKKSCISGEGYGCGWCDDPKLKKSLPRCGTYDSCHHQVKIKVNFWDSKTHYCTNYTKGDFTSCEAFNVMSIIGYILGGAVALIALIALSCVISDYRGEIRRCCGCKGDYTTY